jgi:hypothetical protein
MRQRDRVKMKPFNWREAMPIERYDERLERAQHFRFTVNGAHQFCDPPSVTKHPNLPGNNRPQPAEAEVIRIEVRETNRADVIE